MKVGDESRILYQFTIEPSTTFEPSTPHTIVIVCLYNPEINQEINQDKQLVQSSCDFLNLNLLKANPAIVGPKAR
jgi:hypothetical protein